MIEACDENIRMLLFLCVIIGLLPDVPFETLKMSKNVEKGTKKGHKSLYKKIYFLI